MELRNYLQTSPSLDELRNHLRITSHDLDGELLAKLRAATLSAEHEISTVIALSSFTLTRDFATAITLRYPLVEVESVKVDGVALATEEYSVRHGTLILATEGTSVEVCYKAGLAQVPEDIKAAILLLAGSLFNNPTDRPEERDRTTARNLLRPYRNWGEC